MDERNNQPELSSSNVEPVAPQTPPPSGIRRDALVLIVVVIAVAVMISSAVFWSHKNKGLPAPSQNTVANLQGNVTGQVAPDFTLKTIDGKDVKLSDYKGKAVLLNFWATYCEPCKIEMPWFAELNKQYAPQGLQVVGVAMDDAGIDAIRKYSTDLGVNYPILVGKEAVADLYGGMQFLPTTFYIDRQGKIVDRVFGLVSHSQIEDDIKKALGGAATAQK
jgi:peroxiredoxin